MLICKALPLRSNKTEQLKAVPLRAIRRKLERDECTVQQAAEYIKGRMPQIEFKVHKVTPVDILTKKGNKPTYRVSSNFESEYRADFLAPQGNGQTLKAAFIGFIDHFLSIGRYTSRFSWVKIRKGPNLEDTSAAVIRPERLRNTIRLRNLQPKLFAPFTFKPKSPKG